ncbi:MAG: hypothetical protein MPW14_16335 [Candidatus Manganitrophus sp.]|nr:MAG: hypothetical protein MPW14_16335 [Candidatus Manganitrophus sp.]
MNFPEGFPNGVETATSRTSFSDSIWYRPLPPMTPIRACGNLDRLTERFFEPRFSAIVLFP